MCNFNLYRVPQKHRQRLVCCAGRQADYFQDGTARFGRCRTSKYPVHMSPINQTCTAHRSNRSVDSCNKVFLWRYRSTIHRSLHTTPSTNPFWTCNVEVILHNSIKVRRWPKGCMPAVLGHKNESEQIVAPVRSQTSTLYSTQTVRFRTGVPPWTMISLPSCTTY